MQQKLSALEKTGLVLREFCDTGSAVGNRWTDRLEKAIDLSLAENQWFTRDNVLYALQEAGNSLHPQKLQQWLDPYPWLTENQNHAKKIGVISAGNIPMVGFHDLICVYLSGYQYIGRLSTQDHQLLTVFKEILATFDPTVEERIVFTTEKFGKIDSVIATGSNNTNRYFEYYFREIPRLLRKNRNSLAILHGNETDDQLLALGKDVFSYFGLGCRNVSKLYAPSSFDIHRLFRLWEGFQVVGSQ